MFFRKNKNKEKEEEKTIELVTSTALREIATCLARIAEAIECMDMRLSEVEHAWREWRSLIEWMDKSSFIAGRVPEDSLKSNVTEKKA